MSQSKKEIKIGCDGTSFVDYRELNEFQEDIKDISRENLDKLKDGIKDVFKAPLFVWKSDNKLWLLDGHQRKKALYELEQEGWIIPLIPIVEIFANSLKDAKSLILDYISQYGHINIKKIDLYIQKYNIKPKVLNIEKRIEIDLGKKIELKTEKLKPYKKIHFLISCDIENIDKINNEINKLRKMEGIEIVQGSN